MKVYLLIKNFQSEGVSADASVSVYATREQAEAVFKEEVEYAKKYLTDFNGLITFETDWCFKYFDDFSSTEYTIDEQEVIDNRKEVK